MLILLLLNGHIKQRCLSYFCSLIFRTTTTQKGQGQDLKSKPSLQRPDATWFLKKQTVTPISVTSTFGSHKTKALLLMSQSGPSGAHSYILRKAIHQIF